MKSSWIHLQDLFPHGKKKSLNFQAFQLTFIEIIEGSKMLPTVRALVNGGTFSFIDVSTNMAPADMNNRQRAPGRRV
jgi:hypothetical protein